MTTPAQSISSPRAVMIWIWRRNSRASLMALVRVLAQVLGDLVDIDSPHDGHSEYRTCAKDRTHTNSCGGGDVGVWGRNISV